MRARFDAVFTRAIPAAARRRSFYGERPFLRGKKVRGLRARLGFFFIASARFQRRRSDAGAATSVMRYTFAGGRRRYGCWTHYRAVIRLLHLFISGLNRSFDGARQLYR